MPDPLLLLDAAARSAVFDVALADWRAWDFERTALRQVTRREPATGYWEGRARERARAYILHRYADDAQTFANAFLQEVATLLDATTPHG